LAFSVRGAWLFPHELDAIVDQMPFQIAPAHRNRINPRVIKCQQSK
jgi:hypothetical protein